MTEITINGELYKTVPSALDMDEYKMEMFKAINDYMDEKGEDLDTIEFKTTDQDLFYWRIRSHRGGVLLNKIFEREFHLS